MKISINWLKDYVAVGIPAEKLAHRLTMAGMEVEKIESLDGDTVLEMEITPNRPDCLNVLGIARETAAALNRKLKIPKVRKPRHPRQTVPIEILDREGCSRYIGTVIKNIRVAPAPEDLQKKLRAVGVRPVNNIVDITNFCLFETGQPMHAFDYDKLAGGCIIVRRARAGEKITTIDGEERVLDPGVLIIADAKRPVAIAGVMGGKDTEVTAATQTILLESAYFQPSLVRRGARICGVSSESSYRFERGVDILTVESAAVRAVELILKTASGSVAGRSDIFLNKRKIEHPSISITREQVHRFLGTDLTTSRCKTILKNLGFQVKVEKRQVLTVIPPSFRCDIKAPVDVMEEIARIHGYDQIPSTVPPIKISDAVQGPQRDLKKDVRDILRADGFSETILYSLTSRRDLDRSGCSGWPAVAVKNPISQDQELMRPAVLPCFLPVVRGNFNRGQKDLRLFEIGKVYGPGHERETLALVMSGQRSMDWRAAEKRTVDFFDLKGAVLPVLRRFGVFDFELEQAPEGGFAPGEGVKLVDGKTCFGVMGRIHPDVLAGWDIKSLDVYFAQLDLAGLLERVLPTRRMRPVSPFPAVTRDISLAVAHGISYQNVRSVVLAHGPEWLAEVNFVEEYLGEKIPAGQRGLVFSLVYQSGERTLTEEEVSRAHSRICQRLVDQISATLR